jgi:hypothetical protein
MMRLLVPRLRGLKGRSCGVLCMYCHPSQWSTLAVFHLTDRPYLDEVATGLGRGALEQDVVQLR